MGYVPPSRDSGLSRANQGSFTMRGRTTRSSSQSRAGVVTVLDHLQTFNERLIMVEKQMTSMTDLLQRIDARLDPPSTS